VDTQYFERELERRGYGVRVVNLAVGGFNHFERDQQAPSCGPTNFFRS
jgi:hypothetical protein